MKYEFNVEKIERLEAELADEKAKKKAHAIEVRRLREKVTALLAELAAWQRHGVKVTEDCETCGGSGKDMKRLNVDAFWRDPTDTTCVPCGGTGKKLRDGVTIHRNASTGYGTAIFPAEWLEDTDV